MFFTQGFKKWGGVFLCLFFLRIYSLRTGVCWAECKEPEVILAWSISIRLPTSSCQDLHPSVWGFSPGPLGAPLLSPISSQLQVQPLLEAALNDDCINTPDVMLLGGEHSGVYPTFAIRVPHWGEAPVAHSDNCLNKFPFIGCHPFLSHCPIPLLVFFAPFKFIICTWNLVFFWENPN